MLSEYEKFNISQLFTMRWNFDVEWDDDETLLRFTWFAFCISSERLHSSAPSFLSSRWSFSRSIEKCPTINIWKVSLTSEESSVDLNNNYSLFVSLIIAPTLFSLCVACSERSNVCCLHFFSFSSFYNLHQAYTRHAFGTGDLARERLSMWTNRKISTLSARNVKIN